MAPLFSVKGNILMCGESRFNKELIRVEGSYVEKYLLQNQTVTKSLNGLSNMDSVLIKKDKLLIN